MTDRASTIFLHFPCFDGLVSAAIAWDFLERSKGWAIDDIRPVNYDVRGTWLETPLPANSAVVDFLYHPGAAFWADHHGTTFLTEEARLDYERRRGDDSVLYDGRGSSCAILLWNLVGGASSDPARYGEMAKWADRTDSASYESVDEAIFGSQPALEIARSLAIGADRQYCEYLLRHMRNETLATVADLDGVCERAQEVRRRTELGLAIVQPAMVLQSGGIAVADVAETGDAMINRYSPYLTYPHARYSVVLVRSNDGAAITAMRNPWLDFESVQLGTIFQRFGGGGHQRVGALTIPPQAQIDPAARLAEIVGVIRSEDEAFATSRKRAIT